MKSEKLRVCAFGDLINNTVGLEERFKVQGLRFAVQKIVDSFQMADGSLELPALRLVGNGIGLGTVCGMRFADNRTV